MTTEEMQIILKYLLDELRYEKNSYDICTTLYLRGISIDELKDLGFSDLNIKHAKEKKKFYDETSEMSFEEYIIKYLSEQRDGCSVGGD